VWGLFRVPCLPTRHANHHFRIDLNQVGKSRAVQPFQPRNLAGLRFPDAPERHLPFVKSLFPICLKPSPTLCLGDRELMAAFVAKTKQCEFCTKAHAAVAQGAYRDETKVSAVLSDLDTAAIEEPLRATLLMLGKLTREHAVGADDIRAVLAAGASRRQIEDALAVCFSSNVIGRLADAFGFFVPGPKAFEAGEIPPRARLPLSRYSGEQSNDRRRRHVVLLPPG
jgi:AhpD family alkylhydroperoxidase